MITRQELEGSWDELKGRLQEKWGQLTDDELQEAKGSANQLVGVIERKTGESRREIEDFLENAVAIGDSVVRQAVDTAGQYVEAASQYAGQATDAVREQYDHVAETVREGYERAGEMVRRRPMESLATAFGAGLITGVVIGLMVTNRK